jgi:hypothetical protein
MGWIRYKKVRHIGTRLQLDIAKLSDSLELEVEGFQEELLYKLRERTEGGCYTAFTLSIVWGRNDCFILRRSGRGILSPGAVSLLCVAMCSKPVLRELHHFRGLGIEIVVVLLERLAWVRG